MDNNSHAKPAKEPSETRKANQKNVTKIKTRGGHTIFLSDENNGADLIIESSSGGRIVLGGASDGESISISDQSGNLISLDAGKKAMNLTCSGILRIEASNIELNAASGISLKSGSVLSLKSNGQLEINGAMVKINC